MRTLHSKRIFWGLTLILLLALLPVLLLAGSVGAAPQKSTPWELANEEDDGVRVYRRDVADSDLAEAKAELIVNVPADRIWKVLLDVEKYPQFMPYVEEIKVMADDATGLFIYHRIDPPLVDGREYTLKFVDTIDSTKGVWLRSWSLADAKGPPQREDQVHLAHFFSLLEQTLTQPTDVRLGLAAALSQLFVFGHELLHPGGNLVRGFIPTVPREDQPLTLMALEATNGRQGINYHKGVWHIPIIAMQEGQEFMIVDRGGNGENCDEHYLGDPILIDV